MSAAVDSVWHLCYPEKRLRIGKEKSVRAAVMAKDPQAKRWYIYAHKDKKGNVFYVGKGTGRRAWTDQSSKGAGVGFARHPSWYWYVEKHLNNEFSVEILQDDLTEEEAFDAEHEWMGQYDPDTLINWANFHARHVGPTADEYSQALELARETKQLCNDLRGYSTDDPAAIVALLLEVLLTVYEYAPVIHSLQRTGLVRQLQLEMDRDMGMKGEIKVIERLSFWAKKTGQLQLAGEVAKEYFENFPHDLQYSDVPIIKKRLGHYWLDPETNLGGATASG